MDNRPLHTVRRVHCQDGQFTEVFQTQGLREQVPREDHWSITQPNPTQHNSTQHKTRSINKFAGTQFGFWAQFLRWKISSALWKMREDENWWEKFGLKYFRTLYDIVKPSNAGDGYYGGVLWHCSSCGRPAWTGWKIWSQFWLLNLTS